MEIQKHKFILLAYYSSNALGQIRSLGEKGLSPIVVLIQKSTFRIDKSKYISELYNFEDPNQGLDFIINRYGNEPEKPFLYTDCDELVALFDQRYDEIIDKFYFWNAGGKGKLAHYLDKNNQVQKAIECGLRVPRTELVNVGDLPKQLSYPIFTKSINSVIPWSKGNSYICRNEKELIEAYKKMEVKTILLQEFIDKQDETPIEGISINGGADVILTVKSINYRMTSTSHGIFRHVEPFSNKELEDKIIKFIQAIRYTGIFGIEFIIDKNGVAYFLEINLRITQYNSSYAMFGVNLPYIFAQSILKGRIANEEINYSSKRPFVVMSEFEDFKASCLHGNISLWRWIKDVYKTDCFQYYDRKDKKPFYFTLWSKFIGYLKRLGR